MRNLITVLVLALSSPAFAVTQATKQNYLNYDLVQGAHMPPQVAAQFLTLANLPLAYDTATELLAASGVDGILAYAKDTHALYEFVNGTWYKLLASGGNGTFTGTLTVTGATFANGGVDRSTAAALAIGATNATTVNIGATATPVAVTSAGAVTIPSTLGVTGLTTATGGLVAPSNIDTATGTVLTTATSGGLFVANAASDAVTTWTLPAASTKASYCFVQGASSLGSNREVDIATPAGSDLIIGTTTAAGSAGIATTAGASHGIKNTHATAVRGNEVCLKADGTNTWYMTSLSGTWAAF